MWYVIQTMKGKEEKVADEVSCDVAKEDETEWLRNIIG